MRKNPKNKKKTWGTKLEIEPNGNGGWHLWINGIDISELVSGGVIEFDPGSFPALYATVKIPVDCVEMCQKTIKWALEVDHDTNINS